MAKRAQGMSKQMKAAYNPLSLLLLIYQMDWFKDQARFKIGLWARQTGKSFATAAEAVADCLTRPGQTWICVSASERQALEWLAKAKKFAEAFKLVIDSEEVLRGAADAELKSAEIRFTNGSRIIALPANPDTIRGMTGNLILDEFAFHRDDKAIWKAVFPMINSAFNGELKVRVVSTANGKSNIFYKLWTNPKWSRHLITIHDAKRLGLPCGDLVEMEAALADNEAWRQEYLCEFIDGMGKLLPMEMITACERYPSLIPDNAPRYAGFDIGRHHDLSVYWEYALVGGILHTTCIKVLKKAKFAEQRAFLETKIPHLKGIAIDATGIGMQLAEEMADKFGAKVKECMFTAALKGEIFPRMRSRFEDLTVTIPPEDTALREDLNSMERIVGKTGNLTYTAPSTKDGHADHCTAGALGMHAATAVAQGSTAAVVVNVADFANKLGKIMQSANRAAGLGRPVTGASGRAHNFNRRQGAY